MKRTVLLATALALILFSTGAFAQPKKALFFEEALAPTDTIFSTEPSGYSKLADLLRDEGLLVASMSSGEITLEKLAPYDIVVYHPSPERPLQDPEISAFVWYVTQKGGALFIHGGTARVINPLTGIFGISMSAGNLVDASSSMEKTTAGHAFLLDRFPRPPGFELADIKNIGFYGGSPLALSQDALPLVTGDEDCYSDDGVYSIGTFPPVAAAAYIGRGVVLVKSDRAMLNNANIEAYQNKDWATAILDRLASARDTEAERDKSLFSLRSRIADMEATLGDSAEKLKKYENDLADSYGRVKALEAKLQDSERNNQNLDSQLKKLQDERNRLTTTLEKYNSPEIRRTVAIAAGVVVLVIFLVGLFLGRRWGRSRA